MFNNCNSETNGEQKFYNDIKDKIHIIFDVGSNNYSLFTKFDGEVHYFDPREDFIEDLQKKGNKNKQAYFNSFGLGFEEKTLYYYPKYESFYDRVTSCHVSDDANKILLRIRRGKDYMVEKQIDKIDFLKIDTEGFELDVLKGFEDYLTKINVIQFEYGGTFLDNQIKLQDVIHHLQQHGFHRFSYLTNTGVVPITNYDDHYQYCNIVCVNKESDIMPF